jgi:hypothetical protein
VITQIDEYRPHCTAEVVCLKCLKRWIAVWPLKTPLKILECLCGEVGFVIKTGQDFTEGGSNDGRE